LRTEKGQAKEDDFLYGLPFFILFLSLFNFPPQKVNQRCQAPLVNFLFLPSDAFGGAYIHKNTHKNMGLDLAI